MQNHISGDFMKKGEKMSDDLKKVISDSIKKHWAENRELNMKGIEKTAEKLRGRKVGPHTPEWNAKISETETGKIVSDKTRAKQRASRCKFIENNPDAERLRAIKTGDALRGRKQSPEVVAAVKEKWKDPAYREMRLKQMMQFNVPNNPETRMIEILKTHDLPYRFVGDGDLIIGGFNPDFVNCNGKKVLIEVFGDYWHTRKDWEARDERRFDVFSQLGYVTVVFWEHELVKSREFTDSPTMCESEIVSRITDAETCLGGLKAGGTNAW